MTIAFFQSLSEWHVKNHIIEPLEGYVEHLIVKEESKEAFYVKDLSDCLGFVLFLAHHDLEKLE